MKSILTILLALILSVATTSAQQPKLVLRVGYLPATHDSLLFIAKDRNLFPPELDVRLVKYTSSPDILTDMQAEHVDIGIPGVAAPIQSICRGAPFKIVGGAAQESAAVVLRPEKSRGIDWKKLDNNPREKAKKFAGYKIGSVRQSTGDALFRIATTNIPVTINDSYRNPKDILIDLKGEKLDGAVLWSPHMTAAEADGMEIVMWLGEVMPNHVCCRQVVREDYLTRHEEAVAMYLEGLIRAMNFYQNPDNKEAVLKAVENYLVNPRNVLEIELYGKMRTKLSIDLNQSGVNQYLRAMNSGGLLAGQCASISDNVYASTLQRAYQRIGLPPELAKKAVEQGYLSVKERIRSLVK